MKVATVVLFASFAAAVSADEVNCRLPANAVAPWWFTSKIEGPYRCDKKHDSKPWAMLNSFREGGLAGSHYKLTNDLNDPECLTNWTYYKSDGKTVILDKVERTTKYGNIFRWCPLPVYQIGGKEGTQWAYCDCSVTTAPPPVTTTTAPPPVTTTPAPPPAVTTATPTVTTTPPRVVCPDAS